jgi:hypothetical protein
VLLEDSAPLRIGPDLHPLGMFAVIPMEEGVHRVTVLEFGTPPPTDDPPVTIAEVRERAHRVAGVDLGLRDEGHLLSRLGGATLLAANYRAGRVFLAGDAAHVHMPFGGQGLNTGIQDAANLGWKLAAAVNGWAPASLLDTYHDERHPVGEQVCENTKAQMSLLHPLERIGPLRDLLGELLRFQDVTQYLFEVLSAVNIQYPVHYPDRAGAQPEHPLLGRRLPHVPITVAGTTTTTAETLRGSRGVLLDLTDGAAAPDLSGWEDRVDRVTAQPTERIDAAVVLARPDGYVVWAERSGVDAEGLRLALATWFGAPVPVGAPV